jgi:hypothetical protein
MVKVIKNKVLRLLALASGLIFSSIVPMSAQDLPLLPEDAAVKRAVMPDGLCCYVADNPYVKGFADYALVCRESGRTLLSLKDVPTPDGSVIDSTLIRIMYEVESVGRPATLAVIACGDLRADEVMNKLRYMSYMIPSSGQLSEREISSEGPAPVSFSVSADTLKGLSTVHARWMSPRTPKELAWTTQPAVYDMAAHELGTIVCSRVRKELRDKDIPVADVSFRHLGSQETMSDEAFAFQVTVRDTCAAEAERVLRTALASVDAYGASSSEIVMAGNQYFRDMEVHHREYERTNAAYVQMCIRACLMDTPLSTSAQRLAYLRSKDVSMKDRERLFASIASALIDMPLTDSISDTKVYLNASDTMAFPSEGPKVGMRLSRKEHLSGGVVWTFSNGFRVVYKKMPTSGKLHYTLALNGGYGDIKELAKGEGAYIEDYLGLCRISGMKARDFLDVLELAGITMQTQVNLSNVMISGVAGESEAALLMRALLAVANDRVPDEESMAYHIECERLRLMCEDADMKGLTDSLMCPDYRYSTYKSECNIPEDLSSKAENLLGRVFSKMNDGVLVLVGDMYESDLKKAILPYIGGFRTREAASRKTIVPYQPVSGSMTYGAEGDGDAIFMNISTRMPMTVENYVASEIACMLLQRIVTEALEPYGADVRIDYARRTYPEDRLGIMLVVTPREGEPMHQNVLTALRHAVSGASGIEVDPASIQACREYMKHKYVVQMQEPAYWLHAVAMRYLDGKDYTTGLASKVDASSVEDIRKILRLIEKGSCIEYIINRK